MEMMELDATGQRKKVDIHTAGLASLGRSVLTLSRL